MTMTNQEWEDWSTSLQGGKVLMESENRAMARIIIQNCPLCESVFKQYGLI